MPVLFVLGGLPGTTRAADIDGHRLSTWQEIMDRDYVAWNEADLVIDTAQMSADTAVSTIEAAIGLAAS